MELVRHDSGGGRAGAQRRKPAALGLRRQSPSRRLKHRIAASCTGRHGTRSTAHQERAATLSQQVHTSASYLAEHMAEAPVLVLACVSHDGSPSSMGRGASIYPAVQNLMLAARALGLGTALTTLHKRYEREVKEILSIPENVETAALIPMGYPAEPEHFGGSRRVPASEVTYQEQWGQKGPTP